MGATSTRHMQQSRPSSVSGEGGYSSRLALAFTDNAFLREKGLPVAANRRFAK